MQRLYLHTRQSVFSGSVNVERHEVEASLAFTTTEQFLADGVTEVTVYSFCLITSKPDHERINR